MKEKNDKPSDPNYSGGEDEPAGSKQKSGARQPEMPVDETDDGPAVAGTTPGSKSKSD